MRLLVIILLATWMLGCQQSKLNIFHAGSLTIPLQELNEEFKNYIKEKGYDVEIRSEASGSVMAVRKVTDLGRKADIVAVADYTLLKLMYPKYTDFYIAFARNELVLCYTDRSRYCDEISGSNWYEILDREGVKFGFSNPNIDPCGYRAVMAMKLAELHYKKPIFQLIERHTNIRTDGNVIICPRNLTTDGKIVMRDKSVDLIALLESGCLDYAFEYKSVALQHKLRFLELPDEVNLRNFSMSEWYGKVSIKFDDKEIKAKPILYGVTIPKNAENRELAEEYLRYLLSRGREIFLRNHQEFLENPLIFGNYEDRSR